MALLFKEKFRVDEIDEVSEKNHYVQIYNLVIE